MIFIVLILLSRNLSAQVSEVENASLSKIEQSDNLIIKAGYAFRYNDYDEALILYKQAQTLNPKNEIVRILIKIVENDIKDKTFNIDDHILSKEKEAINSVKEEGLLIFDHSVSLIRGIEKQNNLNFAIILLRASEKNGNFILQGIEQSYFNPPNYYFTDRKSRIIEDLIFLGEKYCEPEDIYAWKYFFMGKEEKDLRDKLQNYIISLNYNHSFSPALTNLKSISLDGSFNSFQKALETKGSIAITENSILNDYKKYSSVHTSIIDELILQNQNELNRVKLLPWKVFGGLLVTGAIGISLVSFDATKVVFQEEKDGRKQLTETGKVTDILGWGLTFATIPATALTYKLTSKKKKKIENKINYLQLFD